nr:MAG TPA: hypothetical protein [Caudoviricetes sp.]
MFLEPLCISSFGFYSSYCYFRTILSRNYSSFFDYANLFWNTLHRFSRPSCTRNIIVLS